MMRNLGKGLENWKIEREQRGKLIMKEHIYMDTDLLNSFIAQFEEGLPTFIDSENEEQLTNVQETEVGKKSRHFAQLDVDTGSINIPMFFESPSGKLGLHLEPGKYAGEKASISQTEVGREIMSKQLHDHALDKFEEHLTEQKMLAEVDRIHENHLHHHNYIKINDHFSVIDFNYIKDAIQDKLVDIMLKGVKEEIAAVKEHIKTDHSLTKGQKKAQIKKAEKTFKDSHKETSDTFSDLREILEYLQSLLPSETFIRVGNAVAPIKNTFLRENSRSLYYKYGNNRSEHNVTLMGKCIRKIDSKREGQNDDSFLGAVNMVTSGIDQMLVDIGICSEDDYVVTPIAIYFE